MEWIFNQLRERPELAIFLTIFLGFWLGKLRIAWMRCLTGSGGNGFAEVLEVY